MSGKPMGVVLNFYADSRKARKDIDRLIGSVKSVGDHATKSDKQMEGLGKAAKIGVAGVVAAATGGAFAIGKLATSAIGLAANFEQSQNVLQSALGATTADMKKLHDLAFDLGAATVFSAQDASDAMIELGKAGLKTSEIMGGGVQAAMALAASEGLALADAATATSNAMSAFGISAADLPKVADALAGAARSSTASVGSLMQALQQVSAGANTAGLTLQETVGILAALDNVGIKGADAGTSLKTMLAKLVPQTKKSQDAFAKYGIAVYRSSLALKALKTMGLKSASGGIDDVTESLMKFYQAMGQNRAQAGKSAEEWLWIEAFDNQMVNANGSMKDATQIAGILNKAMAGLSESAKIEAGNLLFGSDASRAASALATLGSKGLQPFIDGALDAGAAAEMADARTKGFKGAMERLSGSVETIQIKLGEKWLPVLTDYIDRFTGWLDTPAGTVFFDNLAAEVEKTATDFATWIDGTLLPAGQRIIDWFKSSEGQAAIQQWGGYLKAIGEAATVTYRHLDELVVVLEKIKKLTDLLPSNLLGKYLPGAIGSNFDSKGGWNNPNGTPKSGRTVDRSPVPHGGPGSVSVTVINGKQEKTVDSVAVAARAARAMRGAA